MTGRRLLLVLFSFMLPLASQGAMELAPAPAVLKFNGFLHSWIDSGENAKGEYRLGGTLLKRLRLRLQAEAYDGATIVVIPELAGGLTLLDGFAAFDLSRFPQPTAWPVTVTVGQFKTPFGQNRMYVPQMLYAVDYSTLSNALFAQNAVVSDKVPSAAGVAVVNNGAASFWDMGGMVTYKDPAFKIELASVGGLGPNLATPNGSPLGLKDNAADYCGRAEIYPMGPMLTLGGSFYAGTHYRNIAGVVTPAYLAGTLWTGGHAKLKMPGKGLEVEGEYISRGTDRCGYTAQPSYWILDEFQLVAIYDRIVDYRSDRSSSGRMGGGVNWIPTGTPFRLSLSVWGDSTGPSEAPSSTRQVLQTQLTF